MHGLQLELQLFRPSDWGADGESSGDVAIYLWACKGMNLVYKLHCGGPWLRKMGNRLGAVGKRLDFLYIITLFKVSVQVLKGFG